MDDFPANLRIRCSPRNTSTRSGYFVSFLKMRVRPLVRGWSLTRGSLVLSQVPLPPPNPRFTSSRLAAASPAHGTAGQILCPLWNPFVPPRSPAHRLATVVSQPPSLPSSSSPYHCQHLLTASQQSLFVCSPPEALTHTRPVPVPPAPNSQPSLMSSPLHPHRLRFRLLHPSTDSRRSPPVRAPSACNQNPILPFLRPPDVIHETRCMD
jgi:hypothetical protein